MVKIDKRCKVCQIIRNQSRGGRVSELQRRIYSTYTKGSGDSLLAIQRDYDPKFGYLSITNHAKRHQSLTAEDMADIKIQQVHKETMVADMKKAIKHGDIRQTIMDIAQDLLEKDPEFRKKIKPSDALKAAKDQFDVEAKQTDQAMELQKMVWAFTSEDVEATSKHNEASRRKIIDVTPAIPEGTSPDNTEG